MRAPHDRFICFAVAYYVNAMPLNELSSAACGAFYVRFIERYYLDFSFQMLHKIGLFGENDKKESEMEKKMS